MNWKNLLGQEQTVEAFKRAIREGNLSHGIFLWGSEGVGKTLAASILGAHWLCLEPTENGPCEECLACRLRLHENHPDYVMVEAEEGGKNIGIEAARQVGKLLSLSPNISARRVIFFPQAADLTVEAANSLLKSIEEPPEGTLFILEARTEEELLPTIRSRCQAWRVHPLSDEVAADWLAREKGMEPEKAALLARVSAGSLGIALKNKDEESMSTRDDVLRWMKFLPGWNAVDIVREASELDKSKKEKQLHPIRQQVEEAFSLFRDLLILKETGNTENLIHQDRLKELSELSKFWNEKSLAEGWNLLSQAQVALERNGNPRLWTEWLWIQLSQKLDKPKRIR